MIMDRIRCMFMDGTRLRVLIYVNFLQYSYCMLWYITVILWYIMDVIVMMVYYTHRSG